MPSRCAHARYVWNLALEVDSTYRGDGTRSVRPPWFAAMRRMLTQVRQADATGPDPDPAAEFARAASGHAVIQQQALEAGGARRR